VVWAGVCRTEYNIRNAKASHCGSSGLDRTPQPVGIEGRRRGRPGRRNGMSHSKHSFCAQGVPTEAGGERGLTAPRPTYRTRFYGNPNLSNFLRRGREERWEREGGDILETTLESFWASPCTPSASASASDGITLITDDNRDNRYRFPSTGNGGLGKN
jgi:hypothetical protein